MESQASTTRRTAPRWRRLLAVALVAALAVAAFLATRAVLDDDDDSGGTLKGPRGSFTLDYPSGWDPLSGEEIGKLRGSPAAVLRRSDPGGIVIVNRQRRGVGSFDKLSRQLDSELGRRIPDFRKVSAKRVTIKAGRAFTYSYIRKRKGTVHVVVIVPVGSRGYTLNAVAPGRARGVARQIGSIIRSFDA